MKKQIVLKIYGKVQGVFFRDSACIKAGELNLSGWVRNEPDGTVKIIAEGDEEKLNELIDWCISGGAEYAKVDRVDTFWQEATNEFNNFIRK